MGGRGYWLSPNRSVASGFGRLARGQGIIVRAEVNQAIDELFEHSTLRLSKAFRAYVRRLMSELQGG